MKVKFGFLFRLVFLCQFSLAQNLINNGSFETQSTCPFGDISLTLNWESASIIPPKLFDSCANSVSTYFGVPLNLDSSLGYQLPRSGHAYAGLNTYSQTSQDYREYLKYNFINKLIVDTRYCLTFYVNLLNYSRYGADGLGAYFCDSSINCPNVSCVLNYIPQVSNPAGNIIMDTLGWTKISGCFTATGNEQSMIIGNFLPDSLVQRDTNRYVSWDWGTFYYIDDVSLYVDSTSAVNELGKDDFGVEVFPNPANNSIQLHTENKSDLLEIKIYNTMGVLVLNKKAINSNEIIDLTSFCAGIYSCEITLNKAKSITKRLIVIKE